MGSWFSRRSTQRGGRRLGQSWSSLLLLNTTLLTVSILAGAWFSPAGPQLEPAEAVVGDAGSARGVFAQVLATNVQVVALLMVGAATLGLLSASIIIWNGYQLGLGLTPLFSSEPHQACLLMRYVPIEFLALVLAAAASMKLSCEIVGALFAAGPVSLRAPALAVAAALVLLVAAAAIEAHVGLLIAALR